VGHVFNDYSGPRILHWSWPPSGYLMNFWKDVIVKVEDDGGGLCPLVASPELGVISSRSEFPPQQQRNYVSCSKQFCGECRELCCFPLSFRTADPFLAGICKCKGRSLQARFPMFCGRTAGVCMRLFCVSVVLCLGSGLATGWSPVQGVLPMVIKWLRKWIRGLGPELAGRAIEKKNQLICLSRVALFIMSNAHRMLI
jgi:hypothetical protein